MKKIKLVSLVSGRPQSSQRPRQRKLRSSPELRLPLTTHQRTPPFHWNRKAQGPYSLIHQGAARPESKCGMSKCLFRFSQLFLCSFVASTSILAALPQATSTTHHQHVLSAPLRGLTNNSPFNGRAERKSPSTAASRDGLLLVLLII